MWWFAPEQQRWVLQPLIDAGLQADDIRVLLFRLAAPAVGVLPHPHELVSDQPARVRAAWTDTIDRMLTLPRPADRPTSPGGGLRRLPVPRRSG